ncbi:MAG TPA: alkaline phosphatase family protein [bacterium]|nr:alkaline phosphatase family protein [bacterium]
MSREKITRRRFLQGLAAGTAGLALGCGDEGNVSLPTATKDGTRVIVVGFDGLDPLLVRQWMDEGRLPNFSRLAETGGFSALGTSIPPQSPVAWSNFITGKNPGGHDIFDFIHRDPKTYLPFLSTSKTEVPEKFWHIGKYMIPSDSASVKLMRKGKAFWEYLGEAGIPTTIFAVPSNYPPVEGPFRSLSGMGTPDLHGGYGSFSYFTDDPPQLAEGEEITGGNVYPVQAIEGRVKGKIIGPKNTFVEVAENDPAPDSEVPFNVFIDPTADAALLEVGDEQFVLQVGEWTDWVQLRFEMVPLVVTVKGMVRFLLKSVRPFKLYVSPINIDPREPAMPISTPSDYSAELCDARGGPFHTQGIPEDTKALSSQVFDNKEFLEQAHTVLAERLDLYHYELDRFRDGLLFFYFSSSDQITHMFWRTMDHDHPAYVPEKDEAFTNVVRDTYERFDKILGEAMEKIDDKTTLMVMSDHGFAPYYKSFHLSTWLLDNGYVKLRDPSDRDSEFLQNVNWWGTKAYTLGINSMYLNLVGREGKGVVGASDADNLLNEIREKLLQVVDPETGKHVISYAYKGSEVYQGEYAKNAPDLVIGYARGYRGSWETALGKFPRGSLLRPNTDEWGGDHCMAAEEVPGSLFTNRRIELVGASLVDLPVTILELFGLPRPKDMIGKNIYTGK